MYCYLNLNDGQEEIFHTIDMLSNPDFKYVKHDDLKVLHCSEIGSAHKIKADLLLKASGMQMYNT